MLADVVLPGGWFGVLVVVAVILLIIWLIRHF
jgi:hypothetical protein